MSGNACGKLFATAWWQNRGVGGKPVAKIQGFKKVNPLKNIDSFGSGGGT